MAQRDIVMLFTADQLPYPVCDPAAQSAAAVSLEKHRAPRYRAE